MNLVGKLTTIQRTLGMSDAAFAAKLGLTDDSSWSLIRAGKRNMGRKTLRAVYRTFPELKDEIFEYTISEPQPTAA